MRLKRATKIIVDPGWIGPSRVLNSLWRVSVTLDQKRDQREGIAQ